MNYAQFLPINHSSVYPVLQLFLQSTVFISVEPTLFSHPGQLKLFANNRFVKQCLCIYELIGICICERVGLHSQNFSIVGLIIRDETAADFSFRYPTNSRIPK